MEFNLTIFNVLIGLKFARKFRSNNFGKNKIFVIGDNKTGTTSIESYLKFHGVKMGNQPTAEMLYLNWLRYQNIEDIISYVHTAQGFQDVPFSKLDLYKILDKEFPESKFILTVRDSPEQWFNSLVTFYTKIWSTDKSSPPTKEDLQKADYRFRGYPWLIRKYSLLYKNIELYSPKEYKEIHDSRNKEIMQYFLNREKDFIKINVSNPKDFERLNKFLGINTNLKGFPHKNKT